MPLALIEVSLGPDDTQKALASFAAMREEIVAMEGNLSFHAFPIDGGVVVLHEWRSHQAFAAYRNSPAFATLIATVKPLATQVPRSRLFEQYVAPA